jgi:phosphate-selective porin OprO/OprP
MSANNRLRFVLTLVLAMLLPAVASAQDGAGLDSKPSGEGPTNKQATEIEQLKLKLEQLQSIVDDQNQVLAELQVRLRKLEGGGVSEAASRRTADAAVVASPLSPAPQSPAADSTKQDPQDKPALLAGWDKGRAVLRSEDGAFETQLTGYAQLDNRTYGAGDHPPNTFLVRRARVVLEGKLQRYFDFKVEGDFADIAGTLLRDAYVNIHRIDEAQFRFGHFRVPISQEELRSDAYQDFVERSLVNNLVPSRSPGIAVSGVLNKGVFEYTVGAFNGKGLLGVNTSNTPEVAVRLRFNPWKNSNSFWTKGFIFGGAVTQGRSGGGLSIRGLTESKSITFFQPDLINGKYIRANGELTWLLGPFTIRAEYDQINQDRENLAEDGGNLPGIVGKGYTVAATYMLTRETKPEAAAVTPRRSLFEDEAGRTGFGAWELKFRYSNLQISDGTSKSNRAESFYFGPNWYLNRFVRYMLDFGIERFQDPLRTPRPGDPSFFVMLNRVQVSF